MGVNKEITNPKADGGAGKVTTLFRGDQVISVISNFEVATADGDASVYRIAKINKNCIPEGIWLTSSGLTGAASVDIGLYRTIENGGAVKAKAKFASAEDITTPKTIAAPLNGLTDLGVANIGKQIWDLAGEASPAVADPEYDLAVTINTLGVTPGTIQVRAKFARNT